MIWSYTDLLILVPMLGRAHTIAPLIDSVQKSTPGAHLLWLCTDGDAEVLADLQGRKADLMTFRPRTSGDYAHKINAGIRATTEPLILMGACDIAPQPGWFEAATAKLSAVVQVVGTNDGGNPRTAKGHSTHTLMTREYAGRPTINGEPGPLYEGYSHEYVDDELVGTARQRGAYAHAPDAMVTHLHPMWGKAEWDDSYRAQQERMRASAGRFRARRVLWT